MSKFNPEQFLSTVYSDTTSTVSIPVPEGEYPGLISKLDVKPVTTQNGEQLILEVHFDLGDPTGEIQAATGRDKNSAKYSCWLDMNGGNIDMSPGKNVGLGRLREAIGQNEEGKPWHPKMMLGQSALCRITHRVDKEDASKVYHEVKSVAAL